MPTRRDAQALLVGSLALGVVLRFALSDHGIFWPDEIYQSFEPAHALVFGHGLIPWEFIEGARNWALPGFIALLLKVSSLAGLDSPTQYIPLVKAVFVVFSMGTALGSYRLARACGADELSAAAAASVFCLAAPVIYFAPRAMSENATALPIVWGLALVLDEALLTAAFGPAASARARRLVIVGASLLGLGVLLRLQSAVFCVGIVVVLAARKRWAALRVVGVTLAVWALLFGALDALTWSDAPGARAHGWFHSAVVYLRFNLIEGKAAGWGVAPWHFFLTRLWASMPWLALCLALGAIGSARRAPGLLLVGGVFLALHSASPHKEYRFILPVLPVFAAMAGVAISALTLARLRALAVIALVASGLVSAVTANTLTFGQLGQYPGREGESAWDDNGPVNRLMLVASQQKDLCGLFTPVHPAWMGGATYLHTKAPLYAPGWPGDCVGRGTCNYAIVPRGTNLPVVAEDKNFILARIPGSPCHADPSYVWRLP